MKNVIMLVVSAFLFQSCASLPDESKPVVVKKEIVDFDTLLKNNQNKPKPVKPQKQVQKFYFKNLKFKSQLAKSQE